MGNPRMPRGAIPTPRNKLAAATPYTPDTTTPPRDDAHQPPAGAPLSGPKVPGATVVEGQPNAKAGPPVARGAGKRTRGA